MSTTISTHGVPAHCLGTPAERAALWVHVAHRDGCFWLETEPGGFSWDAPMSWCPELVPGTVTVTPEGVVTIWSPVLDTNATASLTHTAEMDLRDARVIDPEPGMRYLTRHYVTLDRHMADVLARVEALNGHYPVEPVQSAPATIVARGPTGQWALWSDGKLTNRGGLPAWTRAIRALSKDAEALVSSILGSDAGTPACGWKTVLAISEILSHTPITEGGDRGHYARQTVNALRCRMTHGSECTLYEFTVGYEEGYLHEVATRLEDLTPWGPNTTNK